MALQGPAPPAAGQNTAESEPAIASRLQTESSAHIRVDAAGYRLGDQKIAVLREALVGFDAPSPFVPPAYLQVREVYSAALVFSGPVQVWNQGATHDQSGDRVWWFDFSAVQTPGLYCLYDPTLGKAYYDIAIANDVYYPIAGAAVRAFYYQRCGVPKAPGFAGQHHHDNQACHVGNGQDLQCLSVLIPIPSTAKDLSGGWHDAGDYNKYVNFAAPTLSALLDAYEIGGVLLGDSLNIPESGNGIPDLLDEIRIELEWLLQMQLANGSVLHKVSVTGFQGTSPPGTDMASRYYAPPTASATISACTVFAHGARVFEEQGNPSSVSFAATLEAAALSAWNWLEANPSAIPSFYNNQGFSSADAEISPYSQDMRRLHAAAQLFHLTGAGTYRTWFDSHYQNSHLFQWFWASPFEMDAQQALWAYCFAPQATPAVQADIRNRYQTVMMAPGQLGRWTTAVDAYRAPMEGVDHTWGNNGHKASQGAMMQAMLRLNLDPPNQTAYQNASTGYLNYIHGVNPLGHCFLTNLDHIGVGQSLREMYHVWFGEGTQWDNANQGPGPAPGFVVGGVNPNFAPDPAYSGPTLEPPLNQPILKSYRDWNTGWPENSWEVSEPAIGYQAEYIRLLAAFL